MKQIINSPNAPSPVGPYNQSVRHGHTLYLSGQIAIDADSGKLITDTIQAETKQVMKNIKTVLNQAGLTMDHILKCTLFVTDINQYSAINTIYAGFFNEQTAPARELVEVRRLPKGVHIEISAIAGFPD